MTSFFTYGPASLYKVVSSNKIFSSNKISNVAVHDFFLETTKAPIRVYYPALKPENAEPVRTFRDATSFLNGYVWTLSRNRPWLYSALSTLFSLSRFFIPMRYLEIPNVWRDAKPEGENLPLVIFTHGLKGTGEEITMLLASIAAHGFVVASIHHTDGSSCFVRTGDGKDIWYMHPDPKNYSIRFREEQLDRRVQEMMEVKNVLKKHPDFEGRINESQTVACGFSFGGSTAALATVRHAEEFSACVVIDGWFHMNMWGVNTYFPIDLMKKKILPVPTFFLNSAAFMRYQSGMMAAQLASGSQNHRHKVYGSSTTHMFFLDLASWVPNVLQTQLKSMVANMNGVKSGALTEEYITDVIKWLISNTKGNQEIAYWKKV